MEREEIEKTLKSICAGAVSAEEMARSVLKLGLPDPFCIWRERSKFLMTRVDGELVISGYHKDGQGAAPQKYLIGLDEVFGWFKPGETDRRAPQTRIVGSEFVFGWFLPISNYMLV